MGMSSIVIADQKEFDIYYSYIQPVLRVIIIGIFIKIGLKKDAEISRNSATFITVGLSFGFYFLYLLNSYPRQSMWSFNLYWLALMSFFMYGIFVKINQSGFTFSLGILCVFVSDLYYILPPEVRLYELTYIFIRIINTFGEFLIVKYVLEHYTVAKK